jgi:hypothetical protein
VKRGFVVVSDILKVDVKRLINNFMLYSL